MFIYYLSDHKTRAEKSQPSLIISLSVVLTVLFLITCTLLYCYCMKHKKKIKRSRIGATEKGLAFEWQDLNSHT